MITEDFVSLEVAKLLKEKGFSEPVHYEYHYTISVPQFHKKAHNFNGEEYANCETEWFSAPTIQMAMKWLREDKKILISIFCHIDKGYWFCIQHFIDSPYKFATSESIHRKEEILGKIQYYDTYEQSCEAAIKYSLENLI